MMVHNLNGTAKNDLPAGYTSWLSYWADYSGQLVGECSVIGCRQVAMHGAHVQKDDGKDRRHYIAPMCAYHNEQKGKHLELDDDVELVPPNERNLPVRIFGFPNCER